MVGGAQRFEHYEMAAYGTSRACADAPGQSEVAQRLQQTLDEKKETDAKLTEIGEPINRQCAEETEATGS